MSPTTTAPVRRLDAPLQAAPTALARRVGSLPDRVLLVLLWCSLVVLPASLAGQHRPVVVVPSVLGVLALTWRWRPVPRGVDGRSAVAVLACLVLVAGWVVVQLPLTGERILVNRDPDVYTLTALWLVDSAGLAIPVPGGSDGTLGFDLEGGAWRPQGNHLLPAMSAVLGWLGGERLVLASPLLWGACGLLGVFALATRVVGPAWALLPVVALGGSLPLLDVSRSLYTEPLALALTMLGGALLLDAWRSGRAADFLLAGVALGSVTLARVDGLVALVGVVAGLSPLALSLPRPAVAAPARWGSALVAAAAAPSVVLSVLDLRLFSGVYFDNMRGQIVLLCVAGVLAVAATAAAAAAQQAPPLLHWPGTAARLAPVVAALLLALLGVLATRPLWLVSRGPSPNPLVGALQAQEGLASDPARSYAELTLAWLGWYWGVVPVVLGLVVLCGWLALGVRRPGQGHLACLALLVLPSTLLYLVDPAITPDQVWAVRRFLPVVVPGLLVAVAWALARLARERRASPAGPLAAAVVAVVTVAWPATTLPGLWSVRDEGGSLRAVQGLCDLLGGRPAVVTGVDTLAPTIRVVCGADTYALVTSDPSPRALQAAQEALGGGDVALVTRDPGGLPWSGDVPDPVRFSYPRWEATLLGPPTGPAEQTEAVTVGTVEPTGTVGP